MQKLIPSLLIAIIASAAFAGCTGSNEPQSAGASTAPTTSAGLPTATDAATPNTAPTLVFDVLLNGTALEIVNGSITVLEGENVTFDASGSTDPEGDDLTFAWAVGDNATSTNATFVHVFTAGNVTVKVAVTDAAGLSDDANVTIVATGAGPLRTDTKKFEGTLLVGTQDPAVAAAPCGALEEEDVDQKTFEWTFVGAEADGTMSVVKHVLIQLDSSGDTTLDVDVFFLDPAGKELGKGTTGAADEKIELNDVALGAGKYSIKVVACNVGNIEFTVAATADYYRA